MAPDSAVGLSHPCRIGTRHAGFWKLVSIFLHIDLYGNIILYIITKSGPSGDGRLTGGRPNRPLKKGTVPVGSIDLLRKVHPWERDSPLFQQAAGCSGGFFDNFGVRGARAAMGRRCAPGKERAARRKCQLAQIMHNSLPR